MINLIELHSLHIINATDTLLFQRGTKKALLRGEGALYLC